MSWIFAALLADAKPVLTGPDGGMYRVGFSNVSSAGISDEGPVGDHCMSGGADDGPGVTSPGRLVLAAVGDATGLEHRSPSETVSFSAGSGAE